MTAFNKQFYRERFAAMNGWKLGQCFDLPQLIHNKSHRGRRYVDTGRDLDFRFDHTEWFRLGRQPIAIGCHNYESDEAGLRRFAAANPHLIRLHIPDAGRAASWHYPNGALPMLVTRPDVETVIWPSDEQNAEMAEAYRLVRNPTIDDVRKEMRRLIAEEGDRQRGIRYVRFVLEHYGAGATCVKDLDPKYYRHVMERSWSNRPRNCRATV